MREVDRRREGRGRASLDWSQCPIVESIPGKLGGAWVFKGTRMPVSVVFENLEDGMTLAELLEQYSLSEEQVKAVLRFVVASLEREENREVG